MTEPYERILELARLEAVLVEQNRLEEPPPFGPSGTRSPSS